MKVPQFPTAPLLSSPQFIQPQSQFASLAYPTHDLNQLLLAAAMHQQQQQMVAPFASLANSLSVASNPAKPNKPSSYRRSGSNRRRPQTISSDEESEEERFSDEAILSPAFAQNNSVNSSSVTSSMDETNGREVVEIVPKVITNILK
jgi:hypothetical protein